MVQDAPDAAGICTVCAERAKDWAVGACGHAVCGDCAHRLRVLYGTTACVMCKEALLEVAVVPAAEYADGMKVEDVVGRADAVLDRAVGMWFLDQRRMKELKDVRSWKCSKCPDSAGAVFSSSSQLKAHARTVHRGLYCDTCFAGKKAFVSEMSMYTMEQDKAFSSSLRAHIRKIHPLCQFCKRYVLDDDALFAHLQEAHEACAICERTGRMHEYFRNYAQLEAHYRADHFVCQDDACRGVAFASQLELQAHEVSVHLADLPRNARARRLQVNLQELHGAGDGGGGGPSSRRRPPIDSERDVRMEQERQLARRRAFLSSQVVFSGSSEADRGYAGASSMPPASTDQHADTQVADSSQPYAAAQARGPTTGTAAFAPNADDTNITRPPDDGRFYPMDLPRDQDEAAARNTILVRTMRASLDPAAYEQFRVSSGQFRSGDLSADRYYEAAIEAFGVRSAIRDILPELVALLPSPLLRDPLLRVCLLRTNPSSESTQDQESAAASARAAGRNAPASRPVAPPTAESFPSLSGDSTPQPVRAARLPMRRYAAPGPEDFPRLGRVNKPQGEVPSEASNLSGSGAASAPASSASATVARGSRLPQSQRTAASVLRQAPMQRVFGSTPAPSRMGGGSGGNGPSLPASAFPSLASTTQAVAAQTSGAQAESELSADVSMRTGAVWGGVAARAYGNGNGKRRGPGGGRGRTPAPPPRQVVPLPSPAIPSLGNSNGKKDEFPAPSTSSSASTSKDPAPRRSTVIDVIEVEKARKASLAKSSLPKVGGSGYGFAWDRKRNRQRTKEIKSNLAPASSESRGGSSADSSSGRASSTIASSGGSALLAQEAVQEQLQATSIKSIKEVGSDTGSTPGTVDMAGDSSHDRGEVVSRDFDPYGYLKSSSGTGSDDATSSFFGAGGS